jgi:hypothetical protein
VAGNLTRFGPPFVMSQHKVRAGSRGAAGPEVTKWVRGWSREHDVALTESW